MEKTIGELIRKERRKYGLTQYALAKLLGCQQPQVYDWERGRRTPTVESLKRIADTLCITVDKLIPAEWITPASPAMTLNDYQRQAARTINKKLHSEQQLYHALHGMASEVGEIHGLFQKDFQGHPIDPMHVKKELGDLLWMAAEFCTAMDWTLEEVAQANIDKLRERYPDGFDTDKSLHRKEGDV